MNFNILILRRTRFLEKKITVVQASSFSVMLKNKTDCNFLNGNYKLEDKIFAELINSL